MHRGSIRNVVLVVALVALVFSGPVFGQSTGNPPVPEPKPHEQIVRLWKAQLSEEFLLRKIEREPVVYRLSTDDIIACKAAGVPEPIIEAMMKTGSLPAPVVVDVPPAAAAATAPSLASGADRSWDGLVRRSPGVVLFRNRWEPGRLSFLEAEIRWVDAGDAARNLVLPLAKIQEQFLVCPDDASSDGSCFEWGVKTADAEFRFRDAGGMREMTSKPLDLFDALKAIAPNLAARKYRAKKG